MDRCYYFELANKMVGASFRPEYVIEAIRSVYSDTVLDNYSEHFVHLFINGVLRVTTLNSLEALSLGWKVLEDESNRLDQITSSKRAMIDVWIENETTVSARKGICRSIDLGLNY